MAAPAVTWTFTNGTTSDATQVNTNFTDMINAMSDGSRDFSIGTLTVAGAVTLNGTVTLGNAGADDITFTGSLASSVPIKTNATYSIGGSTTGLLGLYLGANSTFTTKLSAGTNTATYTFTFPVASPVQTGKSMIFDGNGLAEFRYSDKFTASKTADYTATGDESIVTCAPASSMTVTLPAASSFPGKRLTILKTDTDMSKTLTVNSVIMFTQNESLTVVSDASTWINVDHNTTTPWVTYSPTFVGNTPTSVEIFWRRVGDSIQIRGKWTFSAGTATEMQMPLPAGLTTGDTGKIPTIALAGGWRYNSTAGGEIGTVQMEPSKTYVTFGRQGTGSGGLTKLNGNNAAFASIAISMETITVPILNWTA